MNNAHTHYARNTRREYITAELPATLWTDGERAIAQEFPGVFTEQPAAIALTTSELRWMQGQDDNQGEGRTNGEG